MEKCSLMVWPSRLRGTLLMAGLSIHPFRPASSKKDIIKWGICGDDLLTFNIFLKQANS